MTTKATKRTGTRVPTAIRNPSVMLETTGTIPDTPGAIPETDVVTHIAAASGQLSSNREETTEGRRPQPTSALFTESKEGSDDSDKDEYHKNWTTVQSERRACAQLRFGQSKPREIYK